MKYLQLFFLIIATSFTTSAQLVVQVYDGDTYRIFHQGKFQIIRLANVDAPELSQYYGRLVKTEVSKLILTKIVRIQVYGKDRYGRTVAKITVAGKSLDSILISSGWAWHWLEYSHNKTLSVYERLATEASNGMWKCKHNVPPWIWRKLNKKQKRLNEMCR